MRYVAEKIKIGKHTSITINVSRLNVLIKRQRLQDGMNPTIWFIRNTTKR